MTPTNLFGSGEPREGEAPAEPSIRERCARRIAASGSAGALPSRLIRPAPLPYGRGSFVFLHKRIAC